jgi:hypothetical protein
MPKCIFQVSSLTSSSFPTRKFIFYNDLAYSKAFFAVENCKL